MKNVAIISEYNPFHNGHAYQIKLLREQGFSTVIAIMSGNVTQRGELAFADKYKRAEAAVRAGVDLVLELPVPYNFSSSEFFAYGGVFAADRIGVDALSFGSESGDIELLDKHGFGETAAKAGVGAASAEFAHSGLGSNDILGTAYLRALKKLASPVTPITHKRIGDAFLSDTPESEFASATAIRALFANGKIKETEKYMPREAFLTLVDSANKYADEERENRYSAVLLSTFLLSDAEELSSFAELSGGLASRMKRMAERATSAYELFSLSATKVYTNGRIRRAALCALTRTPFSALREDPEYLTLLAANRKGREYLSSGRINIPVCSSVREKKQYKSFAYESRVDSLWSLVKGERTSDAYGRKPFILDN